MSVEDHLLLVLQADEVWRALDAPRHSGPAADFARLLGDEVEAAASACDDLLAGPRAWWPQAVRTTPGTSTLGMVHELLRRMALAVKKQPQDALQLTAIAMTVAEALREEDYPPGTVLRARAQALRDHAFVLSFLQRVPDALEYVERAERAFADVPMPQFDLARLALVKASTLRLLPDRAAEGARLAREAGELFLLFGDRPRYLASTWMEGAAIYETGAIEQAMALWQSVEREPDLDPVLRTNMKHNIAVCLCDLGRHAEAVRPLEECLAEFATLGLATEVTRSRWYLGNALLGTDRPREAILLLRKAWHDFAELRLMADAALAALHLAEALVVTGQPDQVPMICRDAIEQLTKTGMATYAIPALSLLRATSATGGVSREVVRDTHAEVKRRAREEARVFAGAGAGGGWVGGGR